VTGVDVTDVLASHVAGALERPLPARASEATTLHVLDTLASAVAGSRLPAGIAGREYARSRAADGPSPIVADPCGAPIEHAVLANAMAAHADESDDTHELSKSHPGCSVVPVALATALDQERTGADFLRAVACGYDVGPRVNMALWPSFADVRAERRGTPGISGTFGSASAAAVLNGFDADRVRIMFSYVAQQVSGMNTWKRDTEHVEKAFVLAGWPAVSAWYAVSLVGFGWSGVRDVFRGDPNFLDIVGRDADADRLVDALGERFEVERTHLKRHPVGSPVQAPVQGLLSIVRGATLEAADVDHVEVRMPSVLAHTVQRSREMPDINIHYLLSLVLDDGDFTFAAAHDHDRFERWRRSGDERIRIVADPEMEPRRQAIVSVGTTDGRRLVERVTTVHGSPEHPMTIDDVRSKALDLMGPIVGGRTASAVCNTVVDIERAPDLTVLAALLRGADRWT
jgi:2-methylcitrate dehydratase PrpD